MEDAYPTPMQHCSCREELDGLTQDMKASRIQLDHALRLADQFIKAAQQSKDCRKCGRVPGTPTSCSLLKGLSALVELLDSMWAAVFGSPESPAVLPVQLPGSYGRTHDSRNASIVRVVNAGTASVNQYPLNREERAMLVHEILCHVTTATTRITESVCLGLEGKPTIPYGSEGGSQLETARALLNKTYSDLSRWKILPSVLPHLTEEKNAQRGHDKSG